MTPEGDRRRGGDTDGPTADRGRDPALDGADAATVLAAIEARDPLPGTRGFAGALPDGRLVRDVLGRRPLFVDGDDPGAWSGDPTDLTDPSSFPAGAVGSAGAAATSEPNGELDAVWSLPEPDPFDSSKAAVAALVDAVESALAAAEGDGSAAPPTAVAFSGGVDSGVVASGVDGPLYVVGFPGSHDVAVARDAARALDRDLTVVELSPGDLAAAVPIVARATGRTGAMDLSIALPLYLAAERAGADGHERLAVGQGADELFGGYAKVAKAPEDPRLSAGTVAGARRETLATLPAQLERDVLAVRAVGVEPIAPLLDDRVVAAALRLSGELLVDGRGGRKAAFRRAARQFVPDAVAFREKKAVQYGSLVARELDRLARRAGFKRREGDHVERYVASRL